MTGFEVRHFAESDLPEVLELLRGSLGETEVLRRTPELFAWKHLENPFGRSLMLVATDDEGVVGFRALMRWELVAPDGVSLRCLRPVDTATHPRARRKGVFRTLTLAAVEEATAEGADVVFNTPNAQSRQGYLKMGWTEVGSIGAMVRPLRGVWSKAKSYPTVTSATTWAGEEIADRQPEGLRTPRRVEYLKWRFGSHPTARYLTVEGPNGAMAVLRSNLRRSRSELVVSEVVGGAAPAIRTAARGTNASYLVGWASRGSPERRQLVAAGLMPVPGIRALTLVARPLRSLAIDVTLLSKWDIQLSDMELL